MKRTLLVFGIVSGICFLQYVGVDADELVPNGGFEQEVSSLDPKCAAPGWNVSKEGTAVLDDREVHSGKYSLRLMPEARFYFSVHTWPKIKPGKSYVLKFRAKSEGLSFKGTNNLDPEKGVMVRLLPYAGKLDRTDFSILTSDSTFNDGKWHLYESQFSTDADVIKGSVLYFHIPGHTGSLWLDDISIQEIEKSSSG